MNQFEDQRNALAVLDGKPRYQNGWQKPEPQQKRFEDMDLKELQDALDFNNSILEDQYKQHKAKPELGLEGRLQKLTYKIALIKGNIKKKYPEVALSDITPELVDALRDRIAELEKEVKELRGE